MPKNPDPKNIESDHQSVSSAFSIKQDKVKKNPNWQCEICGVFANGKNNVNAHLKGRKHLKNLKNLGSKKKQKSKKEYVSHDESSNLVNQESINEKLKNMNLSSKSLSLKRTHNRSKSSFTQSFKNSSEYYRQRSYSHQSPQDFKGDSYHSNYKHHQNSQHYLNHNFYNHSDGYAYDNWNEAIPNYQPWRYPPEGNFMNPESKEFCSDYNKSNFNDSNPNYSKNCKIYDPTSNETSQPKDNNEDDSLFWGEPKHSDVSSNANYNQSSKQMSAQSLIGKNVNRKVVKKKKDTNCSTSDSSSKTLNCSQSNSKKIEKKKDTISKVPLENQTEGFSNSDKLQDKRVPSENMSEKISHLLNPLNRRDKAEVDRLVTQYSKSKKKESLLKLKLRTENEDCNKDTSKNTDYLFQNIEQLQAKINSVEPESQEICDNNAESCLSNEKRASSCSTSRLKKRKKSSLSVSSSNSNDMNQDTPIPEKDPEIIQTRRRRKSRSLADAFACLKQSRLSSKESDTDIQENLLSKRRNSFTTSNKSKKHKCSSLECLEACIHETGKELRNSDVPNTVDENALIYDVNYGDDIQLPSKDDSNQISKESNGQLDMINQESMKLNILSNANILNVEDLMTMFATQNVSIKKEFDDPLIDAIKNVDVNYLFNASDQQPESLKEVSPSVPDTQLQPQTSVIQDQNTDLLMNNSPAVPQSSTVPAQNSDEFTSKQIENSQSYFKSLTTSDAFQLSFPDLSPFKVYVNISKELRNLQKEEEEKRAVLKEIDKLIDQHQKILNELIAKKIKLETEEDNLISRRSNLTCALSQCITHDSFINNSTTNNDVKTSLKDSNLEIKNSTDLNSALIEVVSQVPSIPLIRTPSPADNSEPHLKSNAEINSNDKAQEEKNCCKIENVVITSCEPPSKESKDKQNYSADDDIQIIPVEPKVVEIPLIDLEDPESPAKKSGSNNLCKEQSKNASGKRFYETKNLTAHETVVNSLKVLNGYMYTCSNDYTAKRFNLEDYEQVVVYKHSKRNVLQLCVDNFRNSNLVFTLCSAEKLISSFNTEDGVPVKTYHFEFPVRCISNGWSKIYAGLNNGTVMVCSWKETKDLVRNLEPIKNMACTIQGGLHVLVILSNNGQVAVRDVERNGLLIRYIKAHSDTPLFMNVYNDYVYLSSLVSLTASNLSTGAVERTIKLTSPITGLAAYENNIFTTSFSGIVRCYPDGQLQNMRMTYGAGKSSLTCVYVYQGWVFTGNRNGEVSIFHYDSSTQFFCHFKNCKCIFTRLEDLERHVFCEVDHVIPSKNCICPWHGCGIQFSKTWMTEDRKNHIKSHFISSL